MIKNLDIVNSKLLFEEYSKIEHQLEWFNTGSQGRQCCIQTRPAEPLFLDGCGSVSPSVNLLDYDYINPLIENTIWAELIEKFNMYRTRFLWINEKSCYSIHKDSSPRIHIPIFTNPQALFYFSKTGFQYLAPDKVHWVDTRSMHSFVNFSDQKRLHLVGCVEG
jgi:hypothetical protein